MKKMILMAVVAACTWFTAPAQVSFSINIGSQPAWGPVGYDYADYYYLPDADAYYDIGARMFVYREGNYWRRGPALPGRYGRIDLYRTHKVVINHVREPWNNHATYYRQYHGFAGRYDQRAIRDANDRKYWQNPGNRYHGQWNNGRDNDHGHDDHGHDNGRGHYDHGHGNGNGRGHGRGH